jgi:hypothetical protein
LSSTSLAGKNNKRVIFDIFNQNKKRIQTHKVFHIMLLANIFNCCKTSSVDSDAHNHNVDKSLPEDKVGTDTDPELEEKPVEEESVEKESKPEEDKPTDNSEDAADNIKVDEAAAEEKAMKEGYKCCGFSS